MKAINYAMENTGDYSKISYIKDAASKTIIYWVEYEYVDFSKVAIRLEEYIFNLKLLETDDYNKFRVNFVGRLDLIYFSFSNYEADGIVRERLDVAIIEPEMNGYRFYGYYDNSIYSKFSKLEIGDGYNSSDIISFLHYFPNIRVATCDIDNKQFLEIKKYVETSNLEYNVINQYEKDNPVP